MDGRRLLLQKEGSLITGINRLGLGVSIPKTIADSAARYCHDFLIDGEAVGTCMCSTCSSSAARTCAREPLPHVTSACGCCLMPSSIRISLVRSYCFPERRSGSTGSRRRAKKASSSSMWKHPIPLDARARAARSSNYKFHETASFIVTKLNDKRSVSLMLWENGKVRPAGNVTIPPNHDIPKPGEVVDCRYLYAFKESGSRFTSRSFLAGVMTSSTRSAPPLSSNTRPGPCSSPPDLSSQSQPRSPCASPPGLLHSTHTLNNIMKPITLPVAELKPALTGLGKVLNGRSTLAILNNIKSRAHARRLDPRAHQRDLDRWATVRLEHPAEGPPATVLLPFDQLSHLVKSCGKGESIEVMSYGGPGLIRFPLGDTLGESKVPFVFPG